MNATNEINDPNGPNDQRFNRIYAFTHLLNDLFFNFFSSFEPLQREEVTAQVIEAVREAVKNG